jgi:RNA polymerase sigma-70 factor (ECF subfamily)
MEEKSALLRCRDRSTLKSLYQIGISRMAELAGDITQLLQAWRAGNQEAESELFARVFPHMRRLAHYLMQRERKGHTLQPSELVDQVYFRLVAARDRDWQNRQHFFAIAARAMRRHLIDYARARPEANFIPLDGMENFLKNDSAKLDLALTIDRLLNELRETKPDWCLLVEMKFFLGLNDEEAAETLGLKLRTMQRMWRDARKWLFERTESGHATQNAG